MKEITKEHTHVEKYYVYEAFDGQESIDEKECRKYEESALGVLRSKMLGCVVNNDWDAWTLMGGTEDNTVVAIKLNNEKDLIYFFQWLWVECPWYLNEIQEKRKKKVEEAINTAYEKHDVILLGKNCEGDYYFIDSRQNIIDNLMSLDKKEEKR